MFTSYLNVYKIFPSFHILSSWFGVVIQWASAVLEFLKMVSGIQINPTILLLRVRLLFMVLLKRRRLSVHVWAKNISIWYSCNQRRINQLVTTLTSWVLCLWTVSIFNRNNTMHSSFSLHKFISGIKTIICCTYILLFFHGIQGRDPRRPTIQAPILCRTVKLQHHVLYHITKLWSWF